MSALSTRTRRPADDVLGRAVVTGLAAGAPVGYLGFAVLGVHRALAQGEPLPGALGGALLTGEDWEVMPFWLLGAVLVGAVVGALAATVWMAVHRRAPTRVWPANVTAAGVAAALTAVPAAVGPPQLVLATPALVLAVALLAGPRVCLGRTRPAS